MTSTDEDSSSEAYLTAATQSDRESSRSPSTFSREDSPATSLTNALDSLSIRVTPSDTHEDIVIAPKKRRAGSTQQLGVLLQPDCRLHRFTRTSNDADIVERPQRLRAINLGAFDVHTRGRSLTASRHRGGMGERRRRRSPRSRCAGG